MRLHRPQPGAAGSIPEPQKTIGIAADHDAVVHERCVRQETSPPSVHVEQPTGCTVPQAGGAIRAGGEDALPSDPARREDLADVTRKLCYDTKGLEIE